MTNPMQIPPLPVTTAEQILELLATEPRPFSLHEIDARVEGTYGYVRKSLSKLATAGQIERVQDGVYRAVPAAEDVSAETPSRLGPPMKAPSSMADYVGHPDTLGPYDHLVRAGRAVVAEARDASGRIIYALRVEFLATPQPAQILTSNYIEEAPPVAEDTVQPKSAPTTAGTSAPRPRKRTAQEAA